MKSRKKTRQEKLADREVFPKIVKLERRFPCFNALHRMGVEAGQDIVLVNPAEVVACMRKVPRGRLITIVDICRHLAKEHRVAGCCSLTTGIFIMTAAHAAEEAGKEGSPLAIPYWRTLKTDGYLNEKFPGGTESQKALLEREGFKVLRAGKRWRVEDYQAHLADE
ncbi:MAG: MGMT family protein [Bacteroidota bacterium]